MSLLRSICCLLVTDAPGRNLSRPQRRWGDVREALGEQVRANLKDVFPFERPRCDRLVGRLLNQLGSPNLPPDLPVRGRKATA
jgi:hypothetical protein